MDLDASVATQRRFRRLLGIDRRRSGLPIGPSADRDEGGAADEVTGGREDESRTR